MQKNMNMIIRSVASIMVATGLFQLFQYGMPSHWHFFTHLSECVAVVGPLFTALGSVIILVPIAKLVAAVGLFMFKRWGWFLAVAVLVLDLAFGLQAAIRICGFSLNPPPQPPIPVGPHTVVSLSMWPTYIIAFISAICVLVFMRKSIRTIFLNKEPA
jgi:hypothetical protein